MVSAAAQIKKEARAREALMRAAERWHAVKGHTGPYDRCPIQTCHQTHRLVAR